MRGDSGVGIDFVGLVAVTCRQAIFHSRRARFVGRPLDISGSLGDVFGPNVGEGGWGGVGANRNSLEITPRIPGSIGSAAPWIVSSCLSVGIGFGHRNRRVTTTTIIIRIRVTVAPNEGKTRGHKLVSKDGKVYGERCSASSSIL